MAVTYGFFNSVNGDRKYNADQMSEYFRGIVSQGVFQHLDSGLAVSAGTGLSVSVAAGRAIIQDRWIQNSAALNLTISAASETYGRKDAVVIRLDKSSRAISITVKTGTPAASPVAPSMTRNATTYEMALAYVNVAAGASSVTVTDKRSDSSVCGWAAVAQATSGEVDQMLNAMKTGFDGVEYDSPVEMVQSCDQLLQNEINATRTTGDGVTKKLMFANLYTGESQTSRFITNDGNVVSYGSSAGVSYVPISSGNTYSVWQNRTGYDVHNNGWWGYADTSKNMLNTFQPDNLPYDESGTARLILPNDSNIAYLVIDSYVVNSYDCRGVNDTVVKIGTNIEQDAILTGLFGYDLGVESDTRLVSPLYNKKWTCVGDSITDHAISGVVYYDTLIADETGVIPFNLGVAGTGYRREEGNGKAFYQRIAEQLQSDSDYVTIMGSINDSTHELGTPDDDSTSLTVCGRIKLAIETVFSIIPNCKLGIISPIPSATQKPSDSSAWMKSYVEAQKAICAQYGIPYLDLFHTSNLRPWSTEQKSYFYEDNIATNTHPLSIAYKIFYNRIKAFLLEL